MTTSAGVSTLPDIPPIPTNLAEPSLGTDSDGEGTEGTPCDDDDHAVAMWAQEFDAVFGTQPKTTGAGTFTWTPVPAPTPIRNASADDGKLQNAVWRSPAEPMGIQPVLQAYKAKCSIVMAAGLQSGAAMVASAKWCSSRQQWTWANGR